MRYLMILLVVLLLVGVGCKKAAVEEDTLLETLDISDCDSNQKEACCEQKCTDFCKANSKVYSKHIINGDHCPCWCD